VKIHDSTFQSNTATGRVSNSIAVLRSIFFENFAPIPGGGLPTFRAELFPVPLLHRRVIQMLRSIPLVSSQMRPMRSVPKFRAQKFPEFSPCPGGEHRKCVNGHCSITFGRILTKPGAERKSGPRSLGIAFHLHYFSANRAVPVKKITTPNFRSNSRRGTCNF
jgi:hypothetical protein